MNAEFWKKRWANNQIGFHVDRFNSTLIKYFSHLEMKKNETILVPLCGKSLDMLWLREQSLNVIGVELSEIACDSFMNENQLRYDLDEKDEKPQEYSDFEIYRGRNITLYQGDFFKFHNNFVKGIYDRAAMIALPKELRKTYANCLKSYNAPILMIGLEFDQSQYDGPPFSLSEKELQGYFSKVKKLESNPLEEEKNTFNTQVTQSVYLVS